VPLATHSLSLTDGTTTVSLVTSSIYLLDYTPRTPTRKDDEWQDITESATVLVQAATSALAQAAINSIEKLLRKAEERQPNTGADRVFVTYQMSNDAAAWRSEVLAGRVELGDDAWRHWNTKTVEALIIWTRRYYWEGVEGELPLYSYTTGTTQTGGSTVTNSGGGGLYIIATGTTGVIPAPVRLEMANNNGVSVSFRRFWLSLDVFAGATSHTIEGEAAVGVGYGGSTPADANSRGGYYQRITWTGAIDHTNWINWTLSSAVLATLAGGRFRMLVRFANIPSANTYIKLALKIPAGAAPLTTIWESGETLLSSAYPLQDLGTIPLPPLGLSAFDDIALILSVRSAGTANLDVDFFALLATDGLHTFEQIGYQIPANDKIIVDGIDRRAVFFQYLAGKQLSIYNDNPPHLYLWPGRNQAIEILFDEGGTMMITRTLSVRAYYRPRRLTV